MPTLLALLMGLVLALPATGEGWTVTGAGHLTAVGVARSKAPTFALALRPGADGTERGALSFTDPAQKLHLRAEQITAFTADDSSATIDGTAHFGSASGVAFRMTLRPGSKSAPGHVR